MRNCVHTKEVPEDDVFECSPSSVGWPLVLLPREAALQVAVLNGRCVIQERRNIHSGLDRAAALCHQDGITHMTSVDFADRILLTSSYDGVVKAWK